MQIKKYLAPTLKEASEKMKEELGDEAVVLSTRIVEGVAKFGENKVFELTAGIEEDFDKSAAEKAVPEEQAAQEKRPDFAEELKKLTEKIYAAKAKSAEEPEGIKIRKSETLVAKPKMAKSFGGKYVATEGRFDKEIKEVIETLFLREVQKKIIMTIVDQLKKYDGFAQTESIDSYVLSSMASMIPTGSFEIPKSDKTKVIALVGPTGVGKTTCIAKLAIISKILHNLDVGLISVDTYRLGAIDQLRIFSEVSNIDLLVAYEPEETAKLLNTFKKKDVVFIDTAGRSQNNLDSLKKTKVYLDAAKVDETFLVMNTTSATKTLLDVMEKFKVLDYKSLIFTKVDEAASYGNILNAVNTNKYPVKFLTNGQTIPDDIIAADPDMIAKLVYTGKLNK